VVHRSSYSLPHRNLDDSDIEALFHVYCHGDLKLKMFKLMSERRYGVGDILRSHDVVMTIQVHRDALFFSLSGDWGTAS
jgi:hypothetical protein